ncbi:hypothetical protein P7K49_030499 [Saguinus oedipus]|uniref:Uncharacterized protein n=1 Tax=Saguinus oedipus TaxID=9490 RepID=A0ABQ9U371_SAGOE|nr:hypothetical protein P7K49_030499 [Saguinus oedipus]
MRPLCLPPGPAYTPAGSLKAPGPGCSTPCNDLCDPGLSQAQGGLLVTSQMVPGDLITLANHVESMTSRSGTGLWVEELSLFSSSFSRRSAHPVFNSQGHPRETCPQLRLKESPRLSPSAKQTPTVPGLALALWRQQLGKLAHPSPSVMFDSCPSPSHTGREAPAIEGADTMSDTSSVSLEVSPGSRETSVATLSPGANSRGWDDGDTRSEHSYSESGASGSSFEELDLEGEGPLGEPQLDPETESVGTTKWPWEPSTPEKGKE